MYYSEEGKKEKGRSSLSFFNIKKSIITRGGGGEKISTLKNFTGPRLWLTLSE
jgi:hypothetical protein